MTSRLSRPPKDNYSVNQRTGKLAEIWVEQFFTAASWTVGKYEIDDGYDYFITPSRSEFDGQCFLVQVKGKAKRQKGGVFAPVARSRLRDYAADVTPVFIFRVFLDEGSAYWVHAQDALVQNPRLASGTGMAQVRLPDAQCVSSVQEFIDLARPILLPARRRGNGIVEAVRSREEYLSNLDETLDVSIEQHGSDSVVTIKQIADGASPKGVTARLADDAMIAIQDMVLYGQSAAVTSEHVLFHGSPVFDELGLIHAQPGRIEVSSAYRQDCRVRLRADDSQFFGPELLLPAHLTRGRMGFTIETTQSASLASRIRGSGYPDRKMLKLLIDLPPSLFDGEPLAHKQSLAMLGQWAERLLAGRRLFGDIRIGKATITFSAPCEGSDQLLEGLATLGKLHHIARITGSDYRVPNTFSISNREARQIDWVYRLFRGEVMDVQVTSATVDCVPGRNNTELADCRVLHQVPVALNGHLICEVPTQFRLMNYSVGPGDETDLRTLTPTVGSKSTVALHWLAQDDTHDEGLMDHMNPSSV
jgi:hypothetical protein